MSVGPYKADTMSAAVRWSFLALFQPERRMEWYRLQNDRLYSNNQDMVVISVADDVSNKSVSNP